MEKNLIVEKTSKYNFSETVDRLKSLAEDDGWNIPAIHDLQQSLAKSGKYVKPVKVLEICKPRYSGQMLELNHERIMSVMMPCRISIYEKDDGKTYVSLLNAAPIAEELPENIGRIMREASDNTFLLVDRISEQ